MADIPGWAWPLTMGLFGLVFGSFANVVIWRVPRGESIVHPPSACPRCGHAIRAIDNIPVISWLVLRGRCRDCAEPISMRYPAVEALSGALWVIAALTFGASVRSVVCAAFLYGLMILGIIDADTGRLPNPVVGALAIVGAAGVLFSQLTGVPAAPLLDSTSVGLASGPVASALLGVLLGGGLSWFVAYAYEKVRKVRGLGMGDVKLLGAMGIYLGPYVLMALLVGALVGSVFAVASGLSRGESSGLMGRKFRFGPFLALGGAITATAGPWIWAWYAGIIGLRVTGV